MKMNTIRLSCVSIFLVLIQSNIVFASRVIPPRDPDVPWYGDPNITSIDDEKILDLWKKSVITCRRMNPQAGDLFISMIRTDEYTSIKLDEKEQNYLIDKLEVLLNQQEIDWNYVLVVMVIMQTDIEVNLRIPQIANKLFKMPRPIIMSRNHCFSFLLMTQILRLQGSIEAAELFFSMAHKDYWGETPMLSECFSKNNTTLSITQMQVNAVRGLSALTPDIGIPLLEKLADEYPEPDRCGGKLPSIVSDDWDPECYFKVSIQWALKNSYQNKMK